MCLKNGPFSSDGLVLLSRHINDDVCLGPVTLPAHNDAGFEAVFTWPSTGGPNGISSSPWYNGSRYGWEGFWGAGAMVDDNTDHWTEFCRPLWSCTRYFVCTLHSSPDLQQIWTVDLPGRHAVAVNFFTLLAVKEFWRAVQVWHSLSHQSPGRPSRHVLHGLCLPSWTECFGGPS